MNYYNVIGPLTVILSQLVHPGGIALTGPKRTGSFSLSTYFIGGNGSLNNHNGKAKFINEFLNLEISLS